MESMFPPPDGNDDLESQINDIERLANAKPGEWPFETMDVDGFTIEIKKPTTNAIHVLNMATSKHAPKDVQNDMISRFVKAHTSEASFSTLMERMIDPDDTFTLENLGEVMRGIATVGTARPTVR